MSIQALMTVIKKSGEIIGVSVSGKANNSKITRLTNLAFTGAKVFYLSVDPNIPISPLDGEHKWADDNAPYMGWVSNIYSDINGQFEDGSEPVLTLKGENIQYLILYSDLIEQHFIEEVEVNGMIFRNSNEKVIIKLPSPSNHVDIKILKVSDPYQPVKLTGIGTGLELEFNAEHIIDYSLISQTQSNAENIQYSVISRSGYLELNNSDNLFTNLIDLDLLDKSTVVDINIALKPFGRYIIEDIDFNIGDSSVKLNLTDDLINLDQIKWSRNNFTEQNITAKYLLDFIMNYIGGSYSFYDSTTDYVFTNTILASAFIDLSNVKEVLVKLCEVTSSAIFQHNGRGYYVKYLEKVTSEVDL